MKKILVFALFFSLCIGNGYAITKVVKVRGRAAYKSGRRWLPLRAGMTLRPGTKVSTGIRSKAYLRVNGHTVVVRPLTIMRVKRSKSSKRISRTNIRLRRGSIRADVRRKKRIRVIFNVSTPVATSSVRGTGKVVRYWPVGGMYVGMLSNSAVIMNKNGKKVKLSGDLKFNQNGKDSAPEGLFQQVKDLIMTMLNDPSLSESERLGLRLFADEFLNNSEGADRIVRNAAYNLRLRLIYP
ncbi:FecR domain-containing protein [Spirochaetota bacterium]